MQLVGSSTHLLTNYVTYYQVLSDHKPWCCYIIPR